MKKENKEVLVLSEEECLKLEKELEKLSITLNTYRSKRGRENSEREWYIVEDGDHGVEEKIIIAEIDKVKRILNGAVRVKDEEKVHNTVNLGDVVELNLIFDEDDQERMVVRLGTVRKNNSEDDFETISVESPLGKAIYKQEVGNTIPYPVNGNMFKAEILSIVNNNVKETESSKAK